MTNSERRAIALDMDGVVIDGMQFHVDAWQHAFRQVAGVELSALRIYLSEGAKEPHFIAEILKEEGIYLTAEQQEELHRAKLARYDEIYRLVPLDGICDTLALMRDLGYPLALVTGAARAVAERALTGLGVRQWFDVVSGSDEIKRGKPYPDPYLKAAESLGIEAHTCLVVENAPAGVQSAKAAGMPCVALETSLPEEYLHEADRVLVSHADLQDLLRAEHALSGGSGAWQLS